MGACDEQRGRGRTVRRSLVGAVFGVALAASLLALPGQALAEEAVAPSDEQLAAEVVAALASEPVVEEGAVALADSSRTVYVSRTGSKYHYSPTCSNMKNPTAMPLSEAVAAGKTACGTCATGSSGGDPTPDPGPAPAPQPNPTPDPMPEPPVTDVASQTLSRLAGPIALDTMRAITATGFASGSCPTVVVATMGGYWDALTASALAGLYQAPVLLTDGATLSAQTEGEIRRLGASRVLIAGGPAAVSLAVE